jgi:hypothetical protein
MFHPEREGKRWFPAHIARPPPVGNQVGKRRQCHGKGSGADHNMRIVITHEVEQQRNCQD